MRCFAADVVEKASILFIAFCRSIIVSPIWWSGQAFVKEKKKDKKSSELKTEKDSFWIRLSKKQTFWKEKLQWWGRVSNALFPDPESLFEVCLISSIVTKDVYVRKHGHSVNNQVSLRIQVNVPVKPLHATKGKSRPSAKKIKKPPLQPCLMKTHQLRKGHVLEVSFRSKWLRSKVGLKSFLLANYSLEG